MPSSRKTVAIAVATEDTGPRERQLFWMRRNITLPPRCTMKSLLIAESFNSVTRSGWRPPKSWPFRTRLIDLLSVWQHVVYGKTREDVRQVCYRLLGAREEAAEVQLERFRECMRVWRISAENGKRERTREHTFFVVNFICMILEGTSCKIGYISILMSNLLWKCVINYNIKIHSCKNNMIYTIM